MNHRSGTSHRILGLSKVAIKHGGRHSRCRTHILKAGKQNERQATHEAKRRAIIQELSQEDRDAVMQMDIDAGVLGAESSSVYDTVPPGDEGFNISHEGGEFEVYDELVQGIAGLTGYRRTDYRDRRDRLENQNAHWDLQIDRLVDAFLEYRMRAEGNDPLTSPRHASDAPGKPLPVMDLVDVFSRQQVSLTTLPTDAYPNESLLHHGFLGSCPLYPTVAISVRTLASYRQTHRTCPRFSIEAQCKTLCLMHKIPYRAYLATQFSIAYDVYLDIQRRVNFKIQAVLGHDTPNYRLRNACPPCFYQLDDDPQLKFSFFCSIDGNESLRRMGAAMHNTTARLDTRAIVSDRWLTSREVNRFKNEVASRPTGNPDISLDDWEDDDTAVQAECIRRWRNAGPEQRKKMFALFDESGIFIATCRHRFVLVGCDMIRSGELAKYGLAIVNRLLEVYGPNIGCAYDIGCAFEATLHHSSLGERARQQNFRLMVGAFHGHAHHRGCQLRWHPLHIEGTGHFEGEGCEHVFSSSNDQARHTRHATRFHRLQAILEHFDHWDEDKYAALGNFLRNHYREALNAIFSLETELDAVKRELHISDEDLALFFAQEVAYLDGLKQAPFMDTLKIKYVQALNALSRFRQEWNVARTAANNVLTSIAATNIHAALLQARRRVDAAYAKLQHGEAYVFDLENQLGIEERWTEDSPEYRSYQEQVSQQEYHDALNELERLVVQRLFELSKLGMSGTGYKLRRQIGKALQRRSEAIRTALTRYNTQAAKLNPPRPALSWKEIAEYSFLAEFDLLRHSRTDVRQEQWAQPAHREAVVKYFKLQRAREEILRLNVEIRRLRTSIHDESVHTNNVLEDLGASHPPLCAALQSWWSLRSSVNNQLIQRLDEIEQLAGYSGQRGIGVRVGATQPPGRTNALEQDHAASQSMEDAEADERQEHVHDSEQLAQFIQSITD